MNNTTAGKTAARQEKSSMEWADIGLPRVPDPVNSGSRGVACTWHWRATIMASHRSNTTVIVVTLGGLFVNTTHLVTRMCPAVATWITLYRLQLVNLERG